ncbi:MAG: vWA domain-containing protein, partial [Pseudomonadota bacterium]
MRFNTAKALGRLGKTWGTALRVVAVVSLCFGWVTHSSADDIEIFEHGSCEVPGGNYRFIFIVDNSGSMSSTEFANSKATIDAAITHVLSSGLPDIQVAVVQYGTYNSWLAPATHVYDVTIPFTNSVTTATTWNRAYGPGGNIDPAAYQDHQPASLAEMRRDDVYAPGGSLDITDATNVQFVFFTDAWGDYPWACCSSLKNGPHWATESYVLPDYGEYDALKNGSVLPNGIKAQFTVLHAHYAAAEIRVGAAVASVGGDYTGTVDANASDPDGSAVTPRRYILGDLTVSDSAKIVSLLDTVFEEITTAAVLANPSVSISASNRMRHRDRLYYSLFGPNSNRNWAGNLKSYRIDSTGELVDALGNPAFDSSSQTFSTSSQSFWSSEVDG